MNDRMDMGKSTIMEGNEDENNGLEEGRDEREDNCLGLEGRITECRDPKVIQK